MPSDTYILTISEAGVSVPSSHASTHLTGGSDPIPVASTSTSGLMSSAIYDQHVVNTAKVSNKVHTGDVTDTDGALTLTKINGVSLSSLGTGILRMASGTPSIATAEQFPTLNQSTTGNANTATTATNIAGGSVGSIPYQTGSGATTMLAAGTSGYVLKSNGSAAPSWSAVDLSSGTSGTLPVSAGGTGATTLAAGIVKSNGTSSFTRVDAPTGAIVGTTDTQTLTNKTMGSGTAFSSAIPVQYGGTGQTTFTAGVVKAAGTTGFTTVSAPTGDIVGTSDTQTLTNKTLTSPTLNSPTLTTPVLGTPSSGTLTSCTGLPLTTGVTGTLPATNGGTGQTSFAVGDLLYADTTTSVAKLADVAAGSVLLSGGVGIAPSYGKVGLTTHVTGTLPVANGGTGAVTLTGYVKGTGTTQMTAAATVPVADISGILPISKGGTGKDFTDLVGFVYCNGTTSVVTETVYANSQISGTLPLANGGTGYTQTAVGELYLTAPTATSIAAANNWYKISGTTTLIAGGSNFSMPSNNRLTYGGAASRKIFVSVSSSLQGSNADEIKIAIAKNGVHVDSSIAQVTVTGASNTHHLSSQSIVELGNGGYVEVFVLNASGTGAVTFDFLNICAFALI